MVYRLRVYNLLIITSMFFGINFLLFAADVEYKDHGWAKLDTVRVNCGDVLFYKKPLGLKASLPDGSVMSIKALKTGFGSYYKAEKDANGAWTVKASTRDPKDPATQFMVSYVGDEGDVLLTSEFASNLVLASDPKTFNVMLANETDAKSDSAKFNTTLWTLVDDPDAGSTLDSCFLQNKATKGLLTAAYDSSSGGSGQIPDLQGQIKDLETKTPYLTITSTSIEGGGKSMVDEITKRIQSYVLDANGQKFNVDGVGGVFEISGNNWAESMCGVSHKSWQIKTGKLIHSRPRNVVIKYMEGTDKTEKVLNTNESATVKLVADVTKHPAWPLRVQLNDLVRKSAGLATLKTSDIARTGYGTDPFNDLTNQWSKIAIEKVVDLNSDDDAGAEKETIAGGSARDVFTFAHDNPEFKGFGKLNIPDFVSGKIVDVNSQSIAWLSQSLTTPGRGMVGFRAMADESDITVCLSDSVSQFPVYRIVYGAAGNTKTIIYKNDVPVQEISNEQNENARISPGVLDTFWVSLNNGFIIVGKGNPGEIILMAWLDPSPAPGIDRVGLGAYKTSVKYVDVEKLDAPIVTVAPSIPYVTDASPIQLGTAAAPAWYKMPLSPPSVGTVVFQATGNEEANLILADDQGEGYIISFGADGNTCTKIIDLKGGGELYGVYSSIEAVTRPTEISAALPTSVEPAASIVTAPAGAATASAGPSATLVPSTPSVGPSAALVPSIKTAALSTFAILDKDKPNKFWVSYYKGRIILGKGDVGKNPFCIYVDVGAPAGIYKIGFSGKATLSNLEIWPEIGFDFESPTSEYAKQNEFSPFSGSLDVVSPFWYSIKQQGPSVVCKDKLSGMQWYSASTPDPGAQYDFTLDIDPTGIPSIKLLFNDPSAQSIKLQTAVTILAGQSDASLRIAQAMSGGAGGMKIFTNLVALGLAGAAGAAGAAEAAAQGAAQAKLGEEQQMAARNVYTEQVSKTAATSAQVQDQANANRQTIETVEQPAITALQLQDAAQLDNATKQWAIVLGLITDSYVVANQSTKSWIISGLEEAYNAVKSLDLTTVSLSIYNRMLKILMNAYNNAYLIKTGDETDQAHKKDWYSWINQLATTLFNSPALMAQGIDVDFKGKSLWFPVPFANPGQGSVVFEAKAADNIFVEFSDNPLQVRNVSNRMYEFVIGMWDNTMFEIHRKNLGDAVYGFKLSDKPDMTPDGITFKKYWININNGKISGGTGDLGQNKLWEWQDPYPGAPVKWVGFSNWLSAITFRNVKVGFPMEQGGGFAPVAPAAAASAVAAPVAVSPQPDASSAAAPQPDTSAQQAAAPQPDASSADASAAAAPQPDASSADAGSADATAVADTTADTTAPAAA